MPNGDDAQDITYNSNTIYVAYGAELTITAENESCYLGVIKGDAARTLEGTVREGSSEKAKCTLTVDNDELNIVEVATRFELPIGISNFSGASYTGTYAGDTLVSKPLTMVTSGMRNGIADMSGARITNIEDMKDNGRYPEKIVTGGEYQITITGIKAIAAGATYTTLKDVAPGRVVFGVDSADGNQLNAGSTILSANLTKDSSGDTYTLVLTAIAE